MSGGTGPNYTYNWNPGGLQIQDLIDVIAGTYNVTVTDQNSCTATTSATITQPTAITFTFTKTDVTCFGDNNGTITISANGGSGSGYEYSINNGVNYLNNNGIFTSLLAGNYTLLVRDGAGCVSASQTTTLTEPIIALTLSVANFRDVRCSGECNGLIRVIPSGGTGPFEYSFNNGTSYSSVDSSNTICVGSYNILVRDANGCTATVAQNIAQPTPLTISAILNNNISCFNANDAQITATVNGGTIGSGYQYSTTGRPNQSSGIFAGLSGGSYVVTVTDANGCTAVSNPAITVTNPTQLTVTAILNNDISCFNANDAQITATGNGGTVGSGYQYNVGSGNQPSGVFSNLSAGSYTITITDGSGCTAVSSPAITVTNPSQLSVSAVLDNNISCFNANDAQITATGTGGTVGSGYQYSTTGRPNQPSGVFSGLSAGSYTITVTDANGCTAVSSPAITVTNPIQLTITAVLDNDISCFNANDAQITATVNGGTIGSGYQYSTTGRPNQSSGIFAGLSGGSYVVTVTDANGCTAVSNPAITVTNPTQLTVTAILNNDISCFNANDAQITATGNGGTVGSGYQYNVGSGNQPSGVFSNLSAGSYTITITDGSGCTAVSSPAITVTNPSQLSVSAVLDNNISCFNANDAQITATGTGGTVGSGYQYSTTGRPNQPSGVFSGLSAGSYTITVTDANGCTAVSSPAIDVINPSEITIAKTITNVRCFGETNGAIDITVSGGVPNFNYSWNNGAFITDDLSGIPVGNYTVLVTDANGCTATEASVVIQPDEITIVSAVTNVSCFGGNDGAINLTVSGGAGGFTFEWNDGNQNEDRTGLVAENYSVTVTDNNNCTAAAINIAVTQPDSLTLSTASIDISCNGGVDGSIDLTVSGGTSPYGYAWSNGATVQDIQNLSAGAYCVTITDANGCQKSICDTIIEPTVISLGTQSIPTLCFGSSDGGITLNASGGTPGYTYSWSNGATTQDIQNLSAGNYCVTVSDSRGCTVSTCTDVTQPDDIVITKVVTDVLCNGESTGAIDITVTGGTGAYTFLWQPNSEQTEDLNGIPADLYGVLVTDVNGCQDTTTTTLTEPSVISVTGIVTNVLCNGQSTGAIDVTVSGGSPGYIFSWNGGIFTTDDIANIPAGNYVLDIEDANGCILAGTSFDIIQPAAPLEVTAVLDNDISCYNANDAQITATATGGTPLYEFSVNGSQFLPVNVAPTLPAGSYLVVAKDANGCLDTIPQAIVVTNPPQLFITTVLDNDISCFNANDAQITATGSGGIGNLEYSIDGNNYQTNGVFNNLSAGSYTLFVKDATDCVVASSPSILVTNPAQLTVAATLNNDITCFNFNDAQITATGNGGTGTYEFSITGPNGPFQQSGVFSGLSEGNYTINIRDANSCTATSNAIVVTNPAELLATIISSTNVNCFGGSDGTATVNAIGGTGAYGYTWNSPTPQSNATAINLPQGNYTVTVNDVNNCTTTVDVVITQPATAVSATAVVDSNVSCFGRNDGEATVTASGGTSATGTYQYLWSNNANGQQTATASNLLAGNYFVTVFDDNGCEATATVTIAQPELLIVTVQLDSNAYCNGNGRGQLTAIVRGGTSPFDYAWSNAFITLASADTFNTNTNLNVGQYEVTVTDANGCTTSRSNTVFERPGVTVSSSEIVRSTCGNSNGSISVVASTQDNPLIYTWSHDAALIAPLAANLPEGSYSLTITDLATCDTVMNFSVVDIDGPQVDGAVVKDSYCEGDNGAISLQISSGTLPYSFSWDFSQFETSATVENLETGTYTVTVSDANQCDTTVSFTITNIPSAEITINETSPQRIILGGEVQLTVSVLSSTGNVGFEWIPSGSIDFSDEDTVIVSPEITTVYQVWVTDSATGCVSRDTITVIVRDKDNLFIPNAITPNGDGVNDVWNIRELAELKNNEVMIFSRWGDVIFTAKPYNNDWDGTFNGQALPAGTYYYILKLDDLGEVRDGNITIIR